MNVKIVNDKVLSFFVRQIMDKFEMGFYSYQDAQNKITEAFQERIAALPTIPSESKQPLLDAITEEGKRMRFSVDSSDESFTLEEIITEDDGLCVEDIIRMQNIPIGEVNYFGMGVDVTRVE